MSDEPLTINHPLADLLFRKVGLTQEQALHSAEVSMQYYEQVAEQAAWDRLSDETLAMVDGEPPNPIAAFLKTIADSPRRSGCLGNDGGRGPHKFSSLDNSGRVVCEYCRLLEACPPSDKPAAEQERSKTRLVQKLDDDGLPLWRHSSTPNELRSDFDDGWMEVNGWQPVLIDEPIEAQVKQSRLSLKEAQDEGVCRICGDLPIASYGNPFILNFGKEFAHKKCLEQEHVGRELEPGE